MFFKKAMLLTLLSTITLININGDSPHGLEQRLNQYHLLMAKSLSCIAKEIPNRHFNPKVLDTELDQQIDHFLTLADRWFNLSFIEDLNEKTYQSVEKESFLWPVQTLLSDCLAKRHEYTAIPTIKESSSLAKNMFLYYRLPKFKHHSKGSYDLLGHLLRKNALCYGNITNINPNIDLSIFAGIRIGLPSLQKGDGCFELISEKVYGTKQLFQAGFNPSLFVDITAGATTIQYNYIPTEKHWKSIALLDSELNLAVAGKSYFVEQQLWNENVFEHGGFRLTRNHGSNVHLGIALLGNFPIFLISQNKSYVQADIDYENIVMAKNLVKIAREVNNETLNPNLIYGRYLYGIERMNIAANNSKIAKKVISDFFSFKH